MIKLINLFLVQYYLFGAFCLPMSNFSMVANLPQMYQNCKVTEDKDLTPIDFITDHLINIDSVFDKHDNGDEQKPHKTDDTIFHATYILLFQKPEALLFSKINIAFDSIKISNYTKINYSHLRSTFIFRPPIFV